MDSFDAYQSHHQAYQGGEEEEGGWVLPSSEEGGRGGKKGRRRPKSAPPRRPSQGDRAQAHGRGTRGAEGANARWDAQQQNARDDGSGEEDEEMIVANAGEEAAKHGGGGVVDPAYDWDRIGDDDYMQAEEHELPAECGEDASMQHESSADVAACRLTSSHMTRIDGNRMGGFCIP